MHTEHPKSVRRRLLLKLYECYLADPLDMMAPNDLMDDGTIKRTGLVANAYYLADRGYVELMTSYNPPMFAAARITADGIDLVENTFEFNLRFPAAPGQEETALEDVPLLIERLVDEAEFSALDGEARTCILRDVQYLRDELARPAARWRMEVIDSVLVWIRGYYDDPVDALPTLPKLEAALENARA
ncbi:MAG: hypothetical protein GY851_23695 [bacterium]|nr:hypothetical protein [bacterium]